jgi:hypothetical protein
MAIPQLMKGLILLLPEDYRAYINDYQNQLEFEGYLPQEIQTLVWETIYESYQGLIKTIPITLIDFLQKIDPNYCFNIYSSIYGYSVVEQIQAEFREDYYKNNLRSMQIAGIALIVFYIILGFLDMWCLPETKETAWLIKLVVISILMVASSLTFYPPIFEQYHQQIIGISTFTAGLGIILTMNLSRIIEFGHHTYYGALMVLIFYLYLISGLRFFNALFVGFCFMFEYLIINNISQSIYSDNQLQFLRYFNDSFCLFAALLVGIIACNISERNIGLNFLIRYTIATKLRNFLHYFECENAEILLNKINKIRYSPTKIITDFLLVNFSVSYNYKFPSKQQDVNSQMLLLPDSKNKIVRNSRLIVLQESSKTQKYDLMKYLKFIRSKIDNFINSLNLFNTIQNINLSFVKNNYCLEYQKILSNIETLFWDDYFKSSLFAIRITLILSFITYGMFSILDIFCLPETRFHTMAIRLVYCLSSLIVLGVSLFEDFFRNFHQIIMFILSLIAEGGIILMIVFSKPVEMGYTTYYAGLIHVLLFIFAFTRLLFFNATLIGCFVIFSYGILAVYYQNAFSSFENTALFISNILFLSVSCVIGAIACYSFEQNSRLDFLTRYTIAHKSQELLAYYEHTKPSPKQLLDLINGIRHSPSKLQEFLMELLVIKN